MKSGPFEEALGDPQPVSYSRGERCGDAAPVRPRAIRRHWDASEMEREAGVGRESGRGERDETFSAETLFHLAVK